MIGIVILNFNSWNLTVDCIESIENTNVENYKIYVVDNLSNEKMTDRFNKIKDKKTIKFIQAKDNRGYSAGNNIGIREAIKDNCAYFLIVNSDIIFHDNSIENMKLYLNNNKKVGIVGPKVYLSSGEIQDIDMLIKTTLRVKYRLIFQKTPLKLLFCKKELKFSQPKDQVKQPFKVHSVSGCCFMISRDCIKKIYPFDETPFLYEEEVIIGTIMEANNLDTIYLTSSEVTHFHGQTTKNLKAFSYIEFVRSEIYYLRNYLNNKRIQLFPLVLIRFLKYCKNVFLFSDYRKNFKQFFKRGLEFL